MDVGRKHVHYDNFFGEYSCDLMRDELIELLYKYEQAGLTPEGVAKLKQYRTPKAVIGKRKVGLGEYYIGLCPTCGNGVYSEEYACDRCGQVLKWEDAER